MLILFTDREADEVMALLPGKIVELACSIQYNFCFGLKHDFFRARFSIKQTVHFNGLLTLVI